MPRLSGLGRARFGRTRENLHTHTYTRALASSSPDIDWHPFKNIQVVVLRCDVTVADDVMSALSSAGAAEASLPPVLGIVHAACPPPTGDGEGEEAIDAPGDAVSGSSALRMDQRFLEAKVGVLVICIFS